MRTALSIVGVGACVVVIACSGIEQLQNVCAGVGYEPLQVNIRDAAGHGAALGATVTVTDANGSYQEVDHINQDTLSIFPADSRGGATYNVRVSRPFYQDVIVNGIRTPGGGCVTTGVVPAVVSATMALQPGAPPIRSVYIIPHRATIDRLPSLASLTYDVVVDADPGISRAVSWRIVGDTTSATFDATTATWSYHCRPTTAFLTAYARAVADTSLIDSSTVGVQGHPGSPEDPPCS